MISQVLILSEKLHSVTSQFDKLRALRFQDAINRVTPRKRLKQSSKENFAKISKSSNAMPSETYTEEVRESDGLQDHPNRVHGQILDDETRALQVSGISAGHGISLSLMDYVLKCSQFII